METTKKEGEMTEDEFESPFNRSSNMLMATIGVFGLILPFTKNPNTREALKLSMLGIGLIQSLFMILSKTQQNHEEKSNR